MLSYRHAFHAGNHADMLKHFILYLVLDYFNQKDKPYWYIDTHSGAGVYDLRDDAAQKIGEYADGIARFQAAPALPKLVADFVAHVGASLPETHLYCGSPWLAQSLLRDSDKMRLFELHPTDFRLLLDNMRAANLGRRCIVKQENGFAGLIALLPPATRRAVVLIDPPYEQKQDYASVVQTLKDALKRFEQGCYLLWYPCLSREESRTLPEKLVKLMHTNYLHAQLHVHTPRADGFGMHGSGMFVLNPPYLLAKQLQETLPEITRVLAQDDGAKFVLDYQIK
ncbi:23S rRNA (adenine(2030)-N(6))-methyltransferase RlmJ [Wielerella bovis]|uniref:23S rRNA (adenine(2030)-N(6))-methyltransferase RlmJ n=1 Tax=Wielerella bovis TaxID=2917790 RepID=UPI002019B9B4|nr:23S rRNA (adenine(2030)-N(6))-methyltransferase RlmJ [Wielerella bovis]ULJ69160.1 23S rRNA (adenine(2030)-N(6))-methyltransferase RlmJ [Wielerella bovis]